VLKWTDTYGFLDTIKDKERYGIFLDMGVGKTSLLLALIDHKFYNDIKKVLIITPKKVSLSTWQNEIDKFSNFKYMKSVLNLIEGTPTQRRKTLKDTKDFAIHIISSSLIEWLYGTKKKVGKKVILELNTDTPLYDLIIVDECSQFKDPSTRRFKALKKISLDKQVFLLSGTPFSNIQKIKENTYINADELYYVMNILNIYKGSITNFREDFCYTTPYDMYNYRMSDEIYNELVSKIYEKSIRKELSLDVKKNIHKLYCKVDDTHLKTLKKDFYIQTKDKETITASNQAIMINKALQVANGFIYNEIGDVVRLNTYKYDMLKTLLNTIKDNVIIFYTYKEDKAYILTHLKGSQEYTNEQDIIDWNSGKIKYLILSPFSSKYGLNLQQGGHTIIWFGLLWSAESYEQANARIYRRGQKNDVDIYYLMAEKSFDDYVFDTLIKKTKTIKDFITYIEENIS
jgi:SNF2 family DNA or RNA helicase